MLWILLFISSYSLLPGALAVQGAKLEISRDGTLQPVKHARRWNQTGTAMANATLSSDGQVVAGRPYGRNYEDDKDLQNHKRENDDTENENYDEDDRDDEDHEHGEHKEDKQEETPQVSHVKDDSIVTSAAGAKEEGGSAEHKSAQVQGRQLLRRQNFASPTPPPTLWPQIGSDRFGCASMQGCGPKRHCYKDVLSRNECQDKAVSANHSFYQYDFSKNKCFTTATCDSPRREGDSVRIYGLCSMFTTNLSCPRACTWTGSVCADFASPTPPPATTSLWPQIWLDNFKCSDSVVLDQCGSNQHCHENVETQMACQGEAVLADHDYYQYSAEEKKCLTLAACMYPRSGTGYKIYTLCTKFTSNGNLRCPRTCTMVLGYCTGVRGTCGEKTDGVTGGAVTCPTNTTNNASAADTQCSEGGCYTSTFSSSDREKCCHPTSTCGNKIDGVTGGAVTCPTGRTYNVSAAATVCSVPGCSMCQGAGCGSTDTSKCCAACADNCDNCDTSGAGRCDTCSVGYTVKANNAGCQATQYVQGGLGYSCPDGADIDSREECVVAIQRLGYTLNVHGMWNGTNPDIQKYCSFEHKSTTDKGYFNHYGGSDFRRSDDLAPICKNSGLPFAGLS